MAVLVPLFSFTQGCVGGFSEKAQLNRVPSSANLSITGQVSKPYPWQLIFVALKVSITINIMLGIPISPFPLKSRIPAIFRHRLNEGHNILPRHVWLQDMSRCQNQATTTTYRLNPLLDHSPHLFWRAKGHGRLGANRSPFIVYISSRLKVTEVFPFEYLRVISSLNSPALIIIFRVDGGLCLVLSSF